MNYLHGFHDPGGEHLFGDKPGWITHTASLSEGGPIDCRPWTNRGIQNIIRLNWGYGSTGTIPLPGNYADFARLCAAFVMASPGCTRWIIGNEPNHANEWPNGQKITPEIYAECYRLCREAIKIVQPQAEVLVAGLAPWNDRDAGPWIPYFAKVASIIGDRTDGYALHAYTHGSDPQLAHSDAKMDGVYQDLHWHFRVYRDWISVIPARNLHLPLYITECNQGDHGWLDQRSGYATEILREIFDYNNASGPKIHCVCFYRWPRVGEDKWWIEGKGNVEDDFRDAVAQGFKSPLAKAPVPAPSGGIHISFPVVSSGVPLGHSLVQAERQMDPRLLTRGVKVQMPPLANDQEYWKAYELKWYNEEEADRLGPDHHIMLDAHNADGSRAVGTAFKVIWPSGHTEVKVEAKPGEPFGANFPMTASLNEFQVHVADFITSERVVGIGMGTDGNPGIHTSTSIRWRKEKWKAGIPTPSDPPPAGGVVGGPQPSPSGGRLNLIHPVADPAFRRITQHFGEHPENYSHYTVDGVPLKGHNGLDFGVPIGSSIVAVDSGRAVEIGDEGEKGYGKYIKLQHAWGQSLYAHLDYIAVQPHQDVAKGYQIAKSGNTGNSTGPHLHFAMRIHPYNRQDGWGGFTDPTPYLLSGGAVTPPPATDHSIALEIEKACLVAAQEFGITWTLIINIVWAETSFRPNIVTGAGAMGVMGIHKATWDEWAVKVPGAKDPMKIVDNIRVGTAYLKWLLDYFDDSRYWALVSYVWGIGYVLEKREIPAIVNIYANKIIHGDDLLGVLLESGVLQ